MTEASPIAKMLLFAYLDERIEWDELSGWADDLGVPIKEIIDLQQERAGTRRIGLNALCPSTSRAEDVVDAIAFAYAKRLGRLRRRGPLGRESRTRRGRPPHHP